MKTDIEHKGMWWSWVETCDICDRIITLLPEHDYSYKCAKT